jgi:hypothetical protein
MDVTIAKENRDPCIISPSIFWICFQYIVANQHRRSVNYEHNWAESISGYSVDNDNILSFSLFLHSLLCFHQISSCILYTHLIQPLSLSLSDISIVKYFLAGCLWSESAREINSSSAGNQVVRADCLSNLLERSPPLPQPRHTHNHLIEKIKFSPKKKPSFPYSARLSLI